MKKTNLTILLLLIANVILAQNDSLLLKRLQKPIPTFNCETIALNSQSLITHYKTTDYDSIYAVLNLWENYCHFSEPTTRLRILLDIQRGTLVDSVYNDYIKKDISTYRNRFYDKMQRENPRYSWQNNKEYYNYVPLNGDYDIYTQKLADTLLKKQTHLTSAYLYCLLFSDRYDEYEKAFYSMTYSDVYMVKYSRNEDEKRNKALTDSYGKYNKSDIINLKTVASAGVFVPIAQMSATFRPSLFVNVHFRTMLKDSIQLLASISVCKFNQQDNFDISVVASSSHLTKIYNTNASDLILLGAGVGKSFYSKNRIAVEFLGGINYAKLNTNTTNPTKIPPNANSTSQDSTTTNYGFETFDLNASINLTFPVRMKSEAGLSISYHYCPLGKLENLAITDLGNQFATVALFFRF